MDKKPPENKEKPQMPQEPSLWPLLSPYKGFIALLIFLALVSNALTLVLPLLISRGIDSYTKGNFAFNTIAWEFGLAAFSIFVFTYLQSIVQTYASERVARDMRTDLSSKISRQSFLSIQTANPSRLLTNLTSDIDSIKSFVSQAIVSIISSVVIILGASILLLSIDWKLGLAVIAVLPIIAFTFFTVLAKVRALFRQSREMIDRLNKVINESILGAALIRVLHLEDGEDEKFAVVNTETRNIGLRILGLFSSMIPIIMFLSNFATLIVLALGGYFVIHGSMSLGNFAAFQSYIAILIFPILIIGFMSNIIAQASSSYGRVKEMFDAPDTSDKGTLKADLHGEIEAKDVSLRYGEKCAFKDVSFKLEGGSKTAIIGPTAAGKTQLLYCLIGLLHPTSGVVLYDGKNLADYDAERLHEQIGFVFQDSIIFNLSIRENIAFSETVTNQALEKALRTAELKDFIDNLPQGLDTIVSERGGSLSGGQKQRIMLARALALDPKILFLDDFTARVDANTEKRILENISREYPELTLLSVTQKIASVEKYDQIIVLMEGEALAKGTHQELLQSSPEYVQIFESQKSTSHYETDA